MAEVSIHRGMRIKGLRGGWSWGRGSGAARQDRETRAAVRRIGQESGSPDFQ